VGPSVTASETPARRRRRHRALDQAATGSENQEREQERTASQRARPEHAAHDTSAVQDLCELNRQRSAHQLDRVIVDLAAEGALVLDLCPLECISTPH
jgi:hypothetical protein